MPTQQDIENDSRNASNNGPVSLRKITDLIDHHGQVLLGLFKDKQSCLNSDDELNLGSQRLDYDDKGSLVYPVASEMRTWAN